MHRSSRKLCTAVIRFEMRLLILLNILYYYTSILNARVPVHHGETILGVFTFGRILDLDAEKPQYFFSRNNNVYSVSIMRCKMYRRTDGNKKKTYKIK